jgi:hypothetical protein
MSPRTVRRVRTRDARLSAAATSMLRTRPSQAALLLSLLIGHLHSESVHGSVQDLSAARAGLAEAQVAAQAIPVTFAPSKAAQKRERWQSLSEQTPASLRCAGTKGTWCKQYLSQSVSCRGAQPAATSPRRRDHLRALQPSHPARIRACTTQRRSTRKLAHSRSPYCGVWLPAATRTAQTAATPWGTATSTWAYATAPLDGRSPTAARSRSGRAREGSGAWAGGAAKRRAAAEGAHGHATAGTPRAALRAGADGGCLRPARTRREIDVPDDAEPVSQIDPVTKM